MIDNLWFSLKEEKWKVGWTGEFYWTSDEEISDWLGCALSLVRSPKDNKPVIVVRRIEVRSSSYIGRDVAIRLVLAFKLKTPPSEPVLDPAYAAKEDPSKNKRGDPKARWVLQLDEHHWVWQWVEEGKQIQDSTVYSLYKMIKDELANPTAIGDNIFDVECDSPTDRVIPVIYQPAVDCLKNFVREVHCANGSVDSNGRSEVEVSLIFENERLRKHGLLNTMYEAVRFILHRRTMDLESFKIHVDKDNDGNTSTFENIYSGPYKINDDDVHGDKFPPIPKHKIRNYFGNQTHPVIFVNTSNHAMAEMDNNGRMWKWEYVPWLDKAPVKLGAMTRKEIEPTLRRY
ncbi:MAG: hypothetical protein M1387_08965 [Thaumarchaeota archaeon]|nr:hypothetical protein [Nitrososphaerota archaeon]